MFDFNGGKSAREVVSEFIDLPKELGGLGGWSPRDKQSRIEYGLEYQITYLGEPIGATVRAFTNTIPNATPRTGFTLICELSGYCIYRVECFQTAEHRNPLGFSGDSLVVGPHFHPWSLNVDEFPDRVPHRLPIGIPLQVREQTYPICMRMMCNDLNITVGYSQDIAPPSGTLL